MEAEKLTREEVLHVAHLARINISEEEIEKYQIDLKQLLDDVNKINDIKNFDEEFLIAPHEHNSELRKDEEGEMLNEEEIMKNVPQHNGNFVEVPVMLNE